MAPKFNTFKSLHEGNLFVLPNAWDAQSALILQETNYPAIGTSSAAVAASLGYADGEAMPFEDYLSVIRRIAASVTIPVTVDMEMGYGKTPEAIYGNILKLQDLGVVGINIEDSIITDGKRSLGKAEALALKLELIKAKLSATKQSFFINVRCDTYLLNVNDKQNETTRRLKIYEGAGTDGIFLPVISDEQDISRAVSETKLPLNVMAVPNLPEISKLDELGVKRLSMGPFLNMKTYSHVRELAQQVKDQNSLKSIF